MNIKMNMIELSQAVADTETIFGRSSAVPFVSIGGEESAER